MTVAQLPDLVLIVGLLIACWTDVRTGLIPNRLTLSLMGAGILLNSMAGNPWTPWMGLGGAFAIHYILWLLRVEKGGDAKLMMGLGALVGFQEMVEATWWCAVVYLPVGLVYLIVTGKLMNIWYTLKWSLHRGLERLPDGQRAMTMNLLQKCRIDMTDVKEPTPTMLRSAPVITVAAILAMTTDLLDLMVQ
ncbi:MAG: prepilin peptidase [Proteobacteria bacterium]|nr:prepilin peptidase [Pseudomonadota bacterium]